MATRDCPSRSCTDQRCCSAHPVCFSMRYGVVMAAHQRALESLGQAKAELLAGVGKPWADDQSDAALVAKLTGAARRVAKTARLRRKLEAERAERNEADRRAYLAREGVARG